MNALWLCFLTTQLKKKITVTLGICKQCEIMLFSRHGSIEIRKASLHKCSEFDISSVLKRCMLLDKLCTPLYTQHTSYLKDISVLSKDNPNAQYIHMYT